MKYSFIAAILFIISGISTGAQDLVILHTNDTHSHIDPIRAGEYAAVPFEQYKQWFAKLPEAFRESVIREWGPVEQSKIMTKDGNLIIPILKRGNLAILPEPMRGYAGDVQRILHSGTLPPPHQYVAVYLYLRHEFKADAVIHLGRHGSLEWLPGKQLGLSDSCAPALLGGDIPCLYPYISDGIGEGILAKRRGGAVIQNDPFFENTKNFSSILRRNPESDRRVVGFVPAFSGGSGSIRPAVWTPQLRDFAGKKGDRQNGGTGGRKRRSFL